MPVVKSIHAAPLSNGAHILDLADMKREGQDLIARAEAEAERIIDAAILASETLATDAGKRGHAEGYERGLAEGREAGQAEGRAEALLEHSDALAALTARWQVAVDAWESARATMLADAREDLVRFALALAERVLIRAIHVDPTLVVEQVDAALQLVAAGADAAITVHPEDEAMVRDALPSIVDRVGTMRHAAITTDESVGRGGCIVRTARGHVDATIAQQFDRMVEALLPEPADEPGP